MLLKANFPLSEIVWFKTGGTAEFFFKPKSMEELRSFLQQTPKDAEIFYLGAGSNLLVRDGGIKGNVVKIGFHNISLNGDLITVEAGALNRNAVYFCLENQLTGLEFLIGIPGTIGGAISMNAGCHGSETKDHLIYATLMLRDGRIVKMTPQELDMSYRHSVLPKDTAVISATFKLERADPNLIEEKIKKYIEHREVYQVGGKTCGSTFKNPKEFPAWQLIDQCGMRGFRIGDAQVSEKHCNFFVNLGSATSSDMEQLGEHVRQTVLEKTGIALEWEIKRVGNF